MNNDKLVEVCDNCLQACCYYGEFLCDKAYSSGTMLKSVEELKKLNLEHEYYWSDEYMLKVYGNSNPFNYREKTKVKNDR